MYKDYFLYTAHSISLYDYKQNILFYDWINV